MSRQESSQAAQGKRRRRSLRRLIGDKRGQSLVEFGLLLPVLILLVLGTIDFGRVYFAYVSVTNSARTGADYAARNCAVSCDEDGIRNAVVADTSDLLNLSPTNPAVSVTTVGWFGPDHRRVDVTVTYTFNMLFPWPGIPESIDVVRTVTARVVE